MKSFAILLCGIAMFLGGCVLGVPHSFPAIDLLCTIRDASTNLPIPSAKVRIIYEAPNPGEKDIVYGPFITDKDGRCHVIVPAKMIWMSGGDAFVGGYLRRLRVSSLGYSDGGIYEGFDRGKLKNSGEYVFYLN